MTIQSVLIANRGEIAVRIARAAADNGLRSVAVYSDVDANALHTRIADEAYRLPGITPADTYMNIPAIIEIALRAQVDSVHPGYGFLSENAEFAAAVTEAGLTWIGPSADVIETLGNKVKARDIAVRVGAPLAPGSDGPVTSWEDAYTFAHKHGLPIAIKAAFGGGGRGLKVVHELHEVEDAFAAAGRESRAAFGRDECFVEKFLVKPRHVEAQVLADTHGNTVVVGLRDCSLQRRNQKLVEEAPAPFLTSSQENQIRQASIDICEAVGYVGAGTVEFLVARDGTINFLEVNTRLQVEHPVTEMTTGVDLIGEQFRVASGVPLSFVDEVRDGSLPQNGHAIEFRLNAEDVAAGYVPCPGTVTRFEAPTGPGIRVDSGITTGSAVPGAYDSMMAKLIVHGATRAQAISRARQAFRELVIEGVASVAPFHQAVLKHPAFVDEFAVHTAWIEQDFTGEFEGSKIYADHSTDQPLKRFGIELNGKRVELGLPAQFLTHKAYSTHQGDGTCKPRDTSADSTTPANIVTSPYAGNFVTWKVTDGEAVEKGQTIAVIEAMKMESNIAAPVAGTVACENINAGDSVPAGTTIAQISSTP